MPALTHISESNSESIRSLMRKMNELNVHYIDKISVCLVASGEKPSSLLLLKRTENAHGIRDSLTESGFHTSFLDRPNCKCYELIFAVEKSSCTRLTEYVYAGDGYNIGISLGYPANAVSSFINKTPGCVHSYNESVKSYSNGLIEGHLVPAFFAYPMHVPERIISDNGVMALDDPSQRVARNYMLRIREIDRTLSNEIEKSFARELSSFTGGKNIYFDSTYYKLKN